MMAPLLSPKASGVALRCRWAALTLAGGLWSLASAAPAQPAGGCVIQRIEGMAAITGASVVPQAAQVGSTLAPNDRLRTQAQSRVTMTCADRLKVVVGPDSEVTVEGVLAGPARPFGMRLLEGIVGFVFRGRPGDGVEVRTPSAVAAVRSTEWAIRVHQGVSEVFAREGAVAVSAGGGAAQLGPGDGVDVTAAGEVQPVVRWRPPRIAAFTGQLGPDW